MSHRASSRTRPPSPAAPREGQEQTRSFRQAVGRLMSTLSLMSALGAAVIGAAATITVGPYLAMGAAILSGNTEPEVPAAAYPWPGAVAGILGLVVGAVLARREEHEKLGHGVLHAAAILLALLPIWHLYALWRTVQSTADTLP